MLNQQSIHYIVNSTKQQILLLTVLMTFLSIVTVFLLQASAPESSPQQVEQQSNTEDEGLLDIEIEESEGDGIVTQMINGWISLYRDFNSGLEIFSDPEELEEDEILNESDNSTG